MAESLEGFDCKTNWKLFGEQFDLGLFLAVALCVIWRAPLRQHFEYNSDFLC